MLPAQHRLRSSADFDAVLRRPGRIDAAASLIVVHAKRIPERADAPARVGFVVSGSVGGAVVRNRTKRRLRAQCGARLAGFRDGVDYVVRARPASASATSADLGAQLDHALDRLDRTARRAR